MSPTIVQVVPDLEPYGGVSSHARTLARALDERAGLPSRFIAPDGTTAGRRERRLLAELARDDGARILLHYSNYGYDRRGCPRWLLAALERRHALSPGTRLVTVFHEVYASGRPWQSSFWLSPVQRRLAARLRRLSDRVVTSLERYGDLLRAWSGAEVTILPVFSTVGEPAAPTPLAARQRRLVVFGSAGLRARAYTTARQALASACAALDIAKIIDVGPGRVSPSTLGGVPVEAYAEQPADAVSALLSDSVAGFLCYPAAFLPKSTVFAAFASHRLVPVCSSPLGGTGDGSATATGPYWNARAPGASWQDNADAAHRWYQDHSLSRHVALYASLLQ